MKRMKKKDKRKKTKLDILKQTKDRTPMPRPVMFRDKKKYDRKAIKDTIEDEDDF